MSRQLVEVRHLVPVIFLAGVQQPCKDVRLPGGGLVWSALWREDGTWWHQAPVRSRTKTNLPSHLLSSGNWSRGLQAADTRPTPTSSYPAQSPPSYLDIT